MTRYLLSNPTPDDSPARGWSAGITRTPGPHQEQTQSKGMVGYMVSQRSTAEGLRSGARYAEACPRFAGHLPSPEGLEKGACEKANRCGPKRPSQGSFNLLPEVNGSPSMSRRTSQTRSCLLGAISTVGPAGLIKKPARQWPEMWPIVQPKMSAEAPQPTREEAV